MVTTVPPSVEGEALISPYGGKLINLLALDEERDELIRLATGLQSLQLSPRSLCDLELLATGAFSPLDRFMGEADYRSVLDNMRLADGTVYTIPITLPVSRSQGIQLGQQIALRSPNNNLLAVMKVEEIFAWDREEEAQKVCRTNDSRHPLVAEMHAWGELYISGPIRVIGLPEHHDFAKWRRTPLQVRRLLSTMGYENVVAFQTRNPLQRAHEELTKRSAEQVKGALLIHPVVGQTKPGDVDHFTRVRSYKALVENYYDPQRTLLSLLPLAMRMAGPREAVWHAIIRRNYGCNHFIVGRDHAGPGNNSEGKPFYGPYDAQQLLQQLAPEVGVQMLPFSELTYIVDEDRYEEVDKVPQGVETRTISGSRVREYLAKGKQLPPWFSRPEVAAILADAYPPHHEQGFCVWFTGLSGAGKSTIAEVLIQLLAEHGRQTTVLDGDVVRTHLSHGLGFSKEDRDRNILRIGFVAAEVVRHQGVAICAAVSPYRAARNEVRNMVGAERFILVHVDTPLAVCEERDIKGLYAKARAGDLKGFTGIDDPYEDPIDPDVVLTAVDCTPEENARKVIDLLTERGFLLEPKNENDGPLVEFAGGLLQANA